MPINALFVSLRRAPCGAALKALRPLRAVADLRGRSCRRLSSRTRFGVEA
jgi:hypothetical protein